MSAIAAIIDTLENKVEKLFVKMKSLEKNNQDLKNELTETASLIQTQ